MDFKRFQGSCSNVRCRERIALQDNITKGGKSKTFAQVHLPSEWSDFTTSNDIHEGMIMSLEAVALVEIEYKGKFVMVCF